MGSRSPVGTVRTAWSYTPIAALARPCSSSRAAYCRNTGPDASAGVCSNKNKKIEGRCRSFDMTDGFAAIAWSCTPFAARASPCSSSRAAYCLRRRLRQQKQID